jgi:Putative exopolysaccharide Exporter (EPS-E)
MTLKLKAIQELKDTVVARNGKPVNQNVVRATIESLGIREIDVPFSYGMETMQLLAAHIFEQLDGPMYLQAKNKSEVQAAKKDDKRVLYSAYASVQLRHFIKDYSTGLFHLLPVFLQIAAIILFGFSLWAFVGFNELQATSVVLGVIIGLVTTGGFVQAIGKQVSFYWYHDDFIMTRKAIKALLITAIKALFGTFLFIGLTNFFLHLYPYQFVLITFVYAFLIGVLLLVLAPLYTIKQRWMISVAVGVGTFLSLGLHFYSSLHVYAIHWLGISVSIVLAVGYLHFFFKRIIAARQKSPNATPLLMLSAYRNFNYFFYGVLVYVFIFIDRIVAWSSTLGRNLPYIVYYEKDYEIGMDLAILVFFLLAGVLEYSIASFSRWLDIGQRSLSYRQVATFGTRMTAIYKRHLGLLLLTSVLIAAVLYAIVTLPWGYTAAFEEDITSLSIKVMIIGGFGYLFLTVGMLNVLYLYTLNKHKTPVIHMAIACLCNLSLGLLASRIIGYEYAAVGMLFGSFVFMVLTTIKALKFFKNLGYHYYAAY